MGALEKDAGAVEKSKCRLAADRNNFMMSPHMGSEGFDHRTEDVMAHRGRAGVWVVGVLCLAAVSAGVVAWKSGAVGKRKARHVTAINTERRELRTAEAKLARRIADKDAAAVLELQKLLAPATDKAAPPSKLSEEEATELVSALRDLRKGWSNANPAGKSIIVGCLGRMMSRIAAQPSAAWSESLVPAREILSMSMTDPNVGVRVAALNVSGQLWSWAPDRSVMELEERLLAEWKEGNYTDARRLLADPTFEGRVAAVMCLAALPLDDKAAPAIELLRDPSWQVRLQVVVSFADRPDLLTTELLLPRLYDFEELAELTASILKLRGLKADQVGLAKMLVHGNPRVRESAIPLMLKRDDLDHVVWLLFLSRDGDETVRFQAVGALEGRLTMEARRRLEEMAAKDPSSAVRDAARKLVPASAETTTAALPPLPGSPSLNPKAN
jgi:hypothetical protein